MLIWVASGLIFLIVWFLVFHLIWPAVAWVLYVLTVLSIVGLVFSAIHLAHHIIGPKPKA